MSEGLILKYFVLNPTSKDPAHREASRSAIIKYAQEISHHNPELAKDLDSWIGMLDAKGFG